MRTPHFWQQRNWCSNLLLPASFLYGLGAMLDRRLTLPQRAALPVISVGNATAGGAGKTPVTMALIPLLQSLGATPHIISRGYGGSATAAHRVTLGDDWQQVGDEPLLLAHAAPTWVAAKRIDAARAAQAAGASMVVADDAHQHHALAKDISLLVIDGNYGIGNGRLLPAGPLREPFDVALSRADAVVIIDEDRHGLRSTINKPLFIARLAPQGDATWLNNTAVFAFAGLARPQKFYDMLGVLGANIIGTHDFPDHHPYRRDEIEALVAAAKEKGATLITTTKDAVKIPADLRAQMRVLEVAIQWDDETALHQWLSERLSRA
jgi:tetraacyldisaccharide 4'-kinase